MPGGPLVQSPGSPPVSYRGEYVNTGGENNFPSPTDVSRSGSRLPAPELVPHLSLSRPSLAMPQRTIRSRTIGSNRFDTWKLIPPFAPVSSLRGWKL
jgi:hypothetical protein